MEVSLICFGNVQVPAVYCRDVSAGGRVVSVRAQVTTEAPATKVEKVSKKDEEGVVVNKFKPKNPYISRCLLNTKITGDDAPGETWHMVFSSEGIYALQILPLVPYNWTLIRLLVGMAIDIIDWTRNVSYDLATDFFF